MPEFDHRPAMDFRESWDGLISSPLTMTWGLYWDESA